MCAFWGWIVELQILKTSVHFSSYPYFKLMYAFSKMLVSSSLSFGVKFSSSDRFFYLLNSCISSKKIFSIGYAFFTILHLHTLSFREVICYIRAFFGWIVELQILKTSVHFSSYPFFKLKYAFSKMFVSCSISFGGEIFKKWSLFLPVE